MIALARDGQVIDRIRVWRITKGEELVVVDVRMDGLVSTEENIMSISRPSTRNNGCRIEFSLSW